MKINKLIEGLDIIETNIKNFDEDIKDVAYNSKNVEDGFAFICIKGFKTDGHEYIDEAIKKGAKLIVVDEFFDTSKLKDKVLFIKTSNTRRALSVISANFFEHPSKNFLLIGVTGTNGKTSTTFMIKSILEQSGHKVGLIGTVKNMIGQKEIEAKHTTPESYDLQKLFFEMKKENVDSVVMEVSSHSLDLHRVDCCDFDVGVFTNLTQDHLDFHGTMENYFAAKLKLFKMSKKRVVNVDDEWGRKIVSIYPDSVTYGINLKADVCAMNVKLYVNKNQFELRQLDNDNKEQVTLNIPGLFSVYNALAAASCAYALGIDLKTIKMGLESVKAIPGRFEIVESNDKFTIVIDYAHTPDGLLNLMMTVDEVAKGRKVLLFGCGGDRDRTKRPIMGEIAGKMADFVIVTSDNPRTEDPIRIIDDILVGLQKTNADYVIIPDRYEAIKYAIQNAKENDFIVLAGKGHETYQILKDRTIHFDEREVVRSILEELKK
ncbi:UDP-N-acetylmuramoyl-L-alanyl-D-glutamate--2,6-diaminopimelate ligase [Caldicellulosiruptor changbaiensis]|uniref:UDP-N-acetylmuramoyl-L-alanyl-D-glutamate--2,6-diaminopimelate ligase n=1 Tax=Caldicellulosiruptor changbaiensis TaxID=1222016 RepID=A0A3T0D7H6_9FIRM|nr:UDP-N-acetylmuramoyl-L-alanyl-D-glutamate--2,6-diaminopimelate ligase [Caldicellulosiruptor changbaiensis]AZT90998.1 UDP-N-acetylmuramoyl-L-alanyl-D-glutamate--2,6-diaminopimelate ligase [Caldicellulosiruptor changbaiensis]